MRQGFTRRAFLGVSTMVAGGSWVSRAEPTNACDAQGANVPPSIRALTPMLDGIVPIADEERRGRIERARTLMVEHRIDAIYLEPGTSLFYFTGGPHCSLGGSSFTICTGLNTRSTQQATTPTISPRTAPRPTSVMLGPWSAFSVFLSAMGGGS